jgi:uncharacterized protein YbjT (DUF2867 family)
MKIVVIGGAGVLGSKVVQKLRDHGHDAIPASPRTGVNTLTGEGLADALTGADVVVDVANSPSFDDDPVMEFFTKSTTNLVAAAKSAGVGHYVAVSIVGCDELPESGYLRAKVAQEKLITESELPYSIVRATQFAEFADAITASLTVGDEVRVPDALIQPIAAEGPRRRGRSGGRRQTTRRDREHRRAGQDLVRAAGSRVLGPARR